MNKFHVIRNDVFRDVVYPDSNVGFGVSLGVGGAAGTSGLSLKPTAMAEPLAELNTATAGGDPEAAVERVSYANGRIVRMLGWLLWIVLVAANVYAIVTLGLGES